MNRLEALGRKVFHFEDWTCEEKNVFEEICSHNKKLPFQEIKEFGHFNIRIPKRNIQTQDDIFQESQTESGEGFDSPIDPKFSGVQKSSAECSGD